MNNVTRGKFIGVVLTCLFGLMFAMPNVLSDESREKLPEFLQNTVSLGLELRGGSHLQLEVDLATANKDFLSGFLDETRRIFRKNQVGYKNLKLLSDGDFGVSFALRNLEQATEAKKLIRKLDESMEIEVNEVGKFLVKLSDTAKIKRNRQIIEQSIEVVRRRIDETGTKEPNIQRQGEDRIIVQLPGVEDPAQVKKMIGKTAKLTFRMVDEDAVYSPDGTIIPSIGSEILLETTRDEQKIPVSVKKEVRLTGDQLEDAQVTTGQYSEPAVSIKFDSVGARKFAEVTAKNVNKRFAMVLDNAILSAPKINEPIMNGSAQISGRFTVKEANDLALLLRAGSLPAPLKVIEESTVGPSLGADSIKDGQQATVLAFVLVSIFMLLCYSVFGFIATIAVVFNLILLFAGLSILGATLTLPGIAGIALTIGMAVDANVLIYERIKEELRLKAKPMVAIQAGYKRAMTTIIDSNLTTLLGAAVLYEFGSGPIRGFAVTLALGILISLFTALSLTKTIVNLWFGRKKKLESLPI